MNRLGFMQLEEAQKAARDASDSLKKEAKDANSLKEVRLCSKAFGGQ